MVIVVIPQPFHSWALFSALTHSNLIANNPMAIDSMASEPNAWDLDSCRKSARSFSVLVFESLPLKSQVPTQLGVDHSLRGRLFLGVGTHTHTQFRILVNSRTPMRTRCFAAHFIFLLRFDLLLCTRSMRPKRIFVAHCTSLSSAVVMPHATGISFECIGINHRKSDGSCKILSSAFVLKINRFHAAHIFAVFR